MKSVRLTLSQVKEKLKLNNPSIALIDEYMGSHKHSKWQCSICNYTWYASGKHILSGNSGCLSCNNMIRITNEIVDSKIDSIIRLDNVKNVKSNIYWKCLQCAYVWNTSVDNVINNKSGCPKCAGIIKLSNNDIDIKLCDKSIYRIDDYINIHTKIQFGCKICGYIWMASPNKVANQNRGCPKCAGTVKLTNLIIDERLKNSNIIRIGSIINANIPIEFLCKQCYYKWFAPPSPISLGKNGCPKCNVAGCNEKRILEIFEDRNFIFYYDYAIRKIALNENKRFEVDFYFPNHNIIIEYNGHQHYQPVCFGGIDKDLAEQNFIKQQARDQYIEQFCQTYKIELICIDGRKFKNKNLEDYILNDLIPNKLLKV